MTHSTTWKHTSVNNKYYKLVLKYVSERVHTFHLKDKRNKQPLIAFVLTLGKLRKEMSLVYGTVKIACRVFVLFDNEKL